MNLNDLFLQENMKFVLFGGKGGVGKTSCATASAVWASTHLDKKILIISTDPAHSLGDSIGQSLTPGIVSKIEGLDNLWGLEIDPEMEQTQLSNALSMLPEEDLPMGDEFKELTSLNPPGIDEALAFGKVLEYLDDSDFDLVIFDTAPTGHTLRLLSIPDMLSSWMGKLLMLRLKMGKILGGLKNLFKRSDNEFEEADELESIKRLKTTVEAAKQTLTDPEQTNFVIVTIAEAMSIYESERLIGSLMQYEIPSEYMIVNQLYPENIDCDFCQLRRQMQQKHLTEIREIYENEFQIIEVPLFDSEIRNLNSLKAFSDFLFR